MTLQQQILQYIEKHPEAWRCKVELASECGEGGGE